MKKIVSKGNLIIGFTRIHYKLIRDWALTAALIKTIGTFVRVCTVLLNM